MSAQMLLETALSNTAAAAVLAAIAFVVTRLCRSAPVAWCLWLLVLVKLVTPPLLDVRVASRDDMREVVASVTALLDASEGGEREDAGSDTLSLPARPEETFAAVDATLATGGELVAEGGAEVELIVLEFESPRDSDAEAPARGFGSGAPAAEPGAGVAIPPRETPPAESSPRAAVSIDPARAIVAVSLVGSLLWLVLAVARVRRFGRLLRAARRGPRRLQDAADAVARHLGLERSPPLLLVPATITPLVWGAGRHARIVLPESLLDGLDERRIETLLAHELAHVRRGDTWVRWFELAVLALFWWNPIAWIARRQLRHAEEACCDAWVLWAYPDNSREYARALLDTVDFLSGHRPGIPWVASGLGQAFALRRRFRMILEGRLIRRAGSTARLALAVFAIAVLPWTPGVSQDNVPRAFDEVPADVAETPAIGVAPGGAPPQAGDPFQDAPRSADDVFDATAGNDARLDADAVFSPGAPGDAGAPGDEARAPMTDALDDAPPSLAARMQMLEDRMAALMSELRGLRAELAGRGGSGERARNEDAMSYGGGRASRDQDASADRGLGSRAIAPAVTFRPKPDPGGPVILVVPEESTRASDPHVFVETVNDVVEARDPSTGNVIWKTRVPVDVPVAAGSGRVVLDARTGRVVESIRSTASPDEPGVAAPTRSARAPEALPPVSVAPRARSARRGGAPTATTPAGRRARAESLRAEKQALLERLKQIEAEEKRLDPYREDADAPRPAADSTQPPRSSN